jgi:hypothetical protein
MNLPIVLLLAFAVGPEIVYLVGFGIPGQYRMRRLLCLFGFHERSRGKAHYEDGDLVSVCRHCHTPMIRIQHGKWVVSR